MKRWMTTACMGVALAAPSISAGLDYGNVDVASVRLGMTPDEARVAMAKHCGIPKARVKVVSAPGRSALPGIYSCDRGRERLQVVFGASPLADGKRPLQQVEKVEYLVPSENRKALYDAAVEKYGPPAVVNQATGVPQWCEHPVAPSDGMQPRCNEVEGPKLELRDAMPSFDRGIDVELVLDDSVYGRRRLEELHRNNVMKPKL